MGDIPVPVDLTEEIRDLEIELDNGRAAAEAYRQALRDQVVTLEDARGSVQSLGKSLASDLRGAFSDLIVDGASLSDVLRSVGTSIANRAFNAAITPVTNQLGGLLAGAITPFARGGIVSSASAFPMRGGTGLVGEAGPEAILPLSRGTDGTLGVRGGGTTVNVTMNVSTPDVAGFQRSRSQIAAELGRAVSRGQRNR